MVKEPKETLNPFEIAQEQIDRAGRKLNLDPATVAEYKSLPEKFKKKDEPAQEGALLPMDKAPQP